MIGYTNRSALFESAPMSQLVAARVTAVDSMIVFGGRIIASWRRTLAKTGVTLEIRPLTAFSAEQKTAVTAAAGRFGRFLGLPVTLQ